MAGKTTYMQACELSRLMRLSLSNGEVERLAGQLDPDGRKAAELAGQGPEAIRAVVGGDLRLDTPIARLAH